MNDINPIKPPIDLPLFTSGEKWTLIIIGLLLFLGIMTWVYWKFGRKYFVKKELVIEKEEVKIDYEKITRERMLEVKKLLERGDYKKFHLEISNLLKFYLGYKYNFAATDMTTQEILREEKIPRTEREGIERFFYKNNMAKFAGVGLERGIAEEVLQIVSCIF